MRNYSYSLSPFILRSINTLETLRKDILLFPLSPKQQLQLRFDTTVSRITYGLQFAGEDVTVEKVSQVLTDHINLLHVTRSPLEEQIISYKNALDTIQQDWLLSDDKLSRTALLTFHAKVAPSVAVSQTVIEEMALYLQSSAENAYVQAAIAQLYCAEKTRGDNTFATFVSYLLLYRLGYNFHDLFSMEKALFQNIQEYKHNYQKASENENITRWIEYYLETLSLHLIDVNNALQTYPKNEISPLVDINDRQKAILALLDAPTAVITNKNVQQIFHISQITASRDLAKLTMLGFLVAHGKGRSVKYSKLSSNY